MDILGIEPDPNFTVATLEDEGVSYDIVLPNAARDHIQQFVMRSDRPYELGILQDMRQRLGRGDLFLDIGANIGNHTLYLASVAGVRVTAFEPNADLCAAMAESIVRNGLENLVSVQAVALGRAAGRARSAKAIPENLGDQSLTPGAGEIAALDELNLVGPGARYQDQRGGNGSGCTIRRERAHRARSAGDLHRMPGRGDLPASDHLGADRGLYLLGDLQRYSRRIFSGRPRR